MEQSSGKKERVILAAGLAAALWLGAAQYLSPLPRLVWAGQDVPVAVLGPQSAALLVYHPSSGTVNAFSFPAARQKKNIPPEQRARDLAVMAGVAVSSGAAAPFYISLSTAPDLDALWGTLNGWRGEPRRFSSAAGWARGAAAASDISPFGLFVLFSEFSGLGASDFFLAEISRQAAGQEPEAAQEGSGAPRVEVFNASGRKDLAALAAKKLRTLGFDVLTAASYYKQERRTRILGYSRDTAAALKLRSALGLQELEIRVKPSQKSVADAAVVLGSDFDDSVLKK
ncbi:MAG: LytR C-terminal domain-containing protein [Elusimicrobia bacterium]|nr:LytR C-terminal domain-containing protein [Elusimicrobiota bacterium]